MIEVYQRSDTFHQAALFQSMHADRKRVFVDMLKWDVPHDGIFEQDQYDTDAASYLILRDQTSGEHRGSVRLLPSEGPHILRDVFPFLCDGEVPVGPRIMEITRLVVSPRVRRGERMMTRNKLGRAMVEFGQMHGVEQYTAVCEMGFLTQLLASGWRIDPLGMPQMVAGSMIGAVLIHVDRDSIDITSEAWRHPGPALRLYHPLQALAA
jgi:N-acyl-L-homoserine lactone synthetase